LLLRVTVHDTRLNMAVLYSPGSASQDNHLPGNRIVKIPQFGAADRLQPLSFKLGNVVKGAPGVFAAALRREIAQADGCWFAGK